MLPFPDEFVRPDYQGGSIANVPATIASWAGVPFQGLPPLRPEFQLPLPGWIRRVVQVVIDGLGWNLLPGLQTALPDLFGQVAVTGRLTSIFPSTTVAALSSLWTGLAPAQHGLVGLRIFLPRWGALGQMIKLSPEFDPRPETLIEAGLEPESFLHGPGFAEQLAAGGIPTYAFKHKWIVNSALSKMHSRGVAQQFGVASPADLFVQMRQLLDAKAGEPLYVSGYWSTVDTLAHTHGPGAAQVAAEAENLLRLLRHIFLDALSPAARQGTLLCVLADHGQVFSPQVERLPLAEYGPLQEALWMVPAGEPRVPYFYARHGRVEQVLAYLRDKLGQALVAWPAGEALEAGLFGPPPHAPVTSERIGDVVAAMRAGYALLAEDEPKGLVEMLGRHGSLTADEMEVPWLLFQLDSSQRFE